MAAVRRFVVADAVSSFGDWLTYVGISVMAAGQGHQGLALGIVLVAHTMPRVVFAPLAGLLADRVDRRAMLAVASAGRGIAALAMALAALTGALWTVQAFHLVRMALGAFSDAAERAALPRLVAPARLARVNALLAMSWSATFILGIAAGGVVTATAGVAAAFALDALTFLVAAAAFATLPAIAPAPAPGRIALRLPRAARRAALAKVPVSIATGAAWILLNLTAGPHAFAIGAAHVARAAGNGVAPLVWPRPWRATVLGLHASTAIGLVGVAAFACADLPLVWAVVWGVGVGANWVTATTVLQQAAPDAVLGRAAALDVAAQALAQCLGGVVAVAVATTLGAGPWVALSGVALGAAAWAALRRA